MHAIVAAALPERDVSRTNGEVRAADAGRDADARPHAAAARDLAAVDAVPVLVRQDDEIGLFKDHPDVFAAYLLTGSPAEALVAGNNLVTELPGQLLRAD